MDVTMKNSTLDIEPITMLFFFFGYDFKFRVGYELLDGIKSFWITLHLAISPLRQKGKPVLDLCHT
jgi:hypothetical protein